MILTQLSETPLSSGRQCTKEHRFSPVWWSLNSVRKSAIVASSENLAVMSSSARNNFKNSLNDTPRDETSRVESDHRSPPQELVLPDIYLGAASVHVSVHVLLVADIFHNWNCDTLCLRNISAKIENKVRLTLRTTVRPNTTKSQHPQINTCVKRYP